MEGKGFNKICLFLMPWEIQLIPATSFKILNFLNNNSFKMSNLNKVQKLKESLVKEDKLSNKFLKKIMVLKHMIQLR